MSLLFFSLGLVALGLCIVFGAWLQSCVDRRKESREVLARTAELVERIRQHPQQADVLRQELHEMLTAYRRKKRSIFM